jgi:hypothetical protein
MARSSLILAILLLPVSLTNAQDTPGRWSKETAAVWYKGQPWLVGCNFIPSTAINQLEMWQADTFDVKTIDRELGWAQDLGFTSVRVFLHDLPWQQDAKGFARRIESFLDIAHNHKIRVMFVLLDSCWHPEPKLGKQPEPKPHLHNSGWVQSPGVAVLKDAQKWKEMEGYVKGVLSRFKTDRRILAWDLWNEPENNNASSYGKLDIANKEKVVLPLVKQVFAWARGVNPSQPITAAPWSGDWSVEEKLSPLNRFLFESSDIITFHRYENLDRTKKSVESLKRYGRPILCTEYMARPVGSTFEAILPYFKKENVAAYCWGFVAGKTQTIYPWDSWKKKYEAEPELWFHDILRGNGKPYKEKEVKLIKQLTGRAIEVKLHFSVDELDPSKPGESYLECKSFNGTDKAVHVPTVYAGGFEGDMSLKTIGRYDFHLVVWAGKAKQETKLLKPGEQIIVFKDSLASVLLLSMDKDTPLKPNQERYYWTCSA